MRGSGPIRGRGNAMEEDLGRNILSPSPDRQVMGGCASELARTNSDASGLTVDRSKDSSQAHNADARPGTSTAWTDEKHGLYLESLETSFVNQLQHFIGLRGCRQEIAPGLHSYQELSANGCGNSDQFMVLQDGCWQKVKFSRKEPLLDSTADSYSIPSNPQICYFASSGRQHNSASHYLQNQNSSCSKRVRNSTVFYELASSSEHRPECRPLHESFADNNREASDQNFVDEDKGERSRCLPGPKRLKMIGADATDNDQVVPFGKSNTRDVSPRIQTFGGIEKAGGSRIAGRNPG
ncbi:hypothetical protein Tsubulata_007296 [Turnera subulata]|uniref:Uncharacterized protein n=1 Tax=Turnera subulata TaxID=218843 RepID=A0A9Q0FRG7_9ROSI|nr:hypothetical protein Tsubulata_007296 [Turnera subulata]